jgi:hypothetical protein
VCDAARTFIERCARVRAKLNEISIDKFSKEDIENLVTTKDADFVGEVADYTLKTIKCRQKHVDKLNAYAARAHDAGHTHKELFGLFAMLLYMSETLGIRVDRYISTREFFNGLARKLARDVSLWDSPVPANTVPPGEIWKWVHEASLNIPATLKEASTPDAIVIGDASRIGYGAVICVRQADGTWGIEMHQQRWHKTEVQNLRLKHSAYSETEAAVRLATHMKKTHSGLTMAYITDHRGFVDAMAKGYSRERRYNGAVSRYRDMQPAGECMFQAGSTNIADKFSRFKTTVLTEADAAAAVALARRYMRERDSGRCYVVAGRADA